MSKSSPLPVMFQVDCAVFYVSIYPTMMLTFFLILFNFLRLLDAGPMVVILTSLVAIFTFGLGENEQGPPGSRGLSAYSVFNRGFERILGSVDVDSLLAQHVGGGLGGGGMMMMMNNNNNNNINNFRENEEPRRVDRGHARNADNDNDDNNNNGSDDDDDDDDDDDQHQPANNRQSRKSGKKARRRNLEQRREIRRQREAAIALGLHEGGEGQDEMIAVQRAIEQQIAEENANGGD